MKEELTIEESKTLIKLGAPAKKASRYGFIAMEDEIGDGEVELPKVHGPIFTLYDILEILPKHVGIHPLEIEAMSDESWFAYYPTYYDSSMCAVELIDALYKLACWYYGEFKKVKRNENESE